MEIMYKNYNDKVEISFDALIVAMWNEGEGGDKKISLNNNEFFNTTFKNPYDAAFAVSLSGRWAWSDDYVYFDEDGYITSFNHWDDKNSPIDIDKIDVTDLINNLKKWHKNKNKKRDVVDNIPRAIHDALQE